MKILHIVPSYVPAYRRGGPIWSVHNLNKWLVRKGVDVIVYTTDIDVKGQVSLEKEVDVDGVKVYYFPLSFPKIWKYWRVLFWPAFIPRHWEYSKELHEAMAKNIKSFDLVHITSTFLFASTLGARYAKRHSVPYIISPRGNLMEPMEIDEAGKPLRPYKKKLYMALVEKKNLAGADAIHFTVEREKKEYGKHAPPFQKAIVIPNGLEIESFEKNVPRGAFRQKFGIGQDKKIVLFLSRISWKKGLDTLIPAFANVLKEEPNLVLVLAGADDERYGNKVKKWIDDYGVKDKVIFTGVILGKDKIAALQDSSLFVLPSYSENFGMAVVDAMYCSLPVVVTNKVGIAPSVIKRKTGLVIEKNEVQLAKAILRILRDEKLAKEMGENGKKLVESEFLMPKIIERWIEAYRSIIRKNRITK